VRKLGLFVKQIRNTSYLERFEMWCWRRMERISWIDRVRNEDVVHRIEEKMNILHTIE
jgi:hypothetical protein